MVKGILQHFSKLISIHRVCIGHVTTMFTGFNTFPCGEKCTENLLTPNSLIISLRAAVVRVQCALKTYAETKKMLDLIQT